MKTTKYHVKSQLQSIYHFVCTCLVMKKMIPTPKSGRDHFLHNKTGTNTTHQRDFLHKLRVFLVFSEFDWTHLNPAPQLTQAPKRSRKPPIPRVMPQILQRQEKGSYSNLLANLKHTCINGYQIFFQDAPCLFLPHGKMHTPPHEEVCY